MTYQITVTKKGTPLQTLTVKAPNALAAIERVETGFASRHCKMRGSNGTVRLVQWTGLEFQARRV